MTCATCRHSCSLPIGPNYEPVLWCKLHGLDASALCADYAREPGTSEPEDAEQPE